MLNIKTKEEVLNLEPNLNPVFDAGVIYDYAYHARDPKEITKKLFELFLKTGGKFKKEEVINVEQTRYNQTQVKTNTEKFNFEKIVLAYYEGLKGHIPYLNEKKEFYGLDNFKNLVKAH